MDGLPRFFFCMRSTLSNISSWIFSEASQTFSAFRSSFVQRFSAFSASLSAMPASCRAFLPGDGGSGWRSAGSAARGGDGGASSAGAGTDVDGSASCCCSGFFFFALGMPTLRGRDICACGTDAQ